MNPENQAILIPNTNDQNAADGLLQNQRTGGTQVLRGQGQTHDERTHTTTPIDSNYPGAPTESEKELARLRLKREVFMEMLKEQIAGAGRQTLKLGLLEGSHVCSTREEDIIPDEHESSSRAKGKKKVEENPR